MEQPAMDSEVVEQPAAEEQENEEQLDIPSEEGEQEAEEEDEIEVDGKKFVLPKSAAEKLKAERLMQADYTRKTQEVAEQRKQIEQQAQSLQQQAKFQQEYIQHVAKITAIDERLQQYANINLGEYIDTDPVAVMKAQEEIRSLQMQRMNEVNNLTQKQNQQSFEQQQNVAKRVQEASAYLSREIPNWSPQKDVEFAHYVANLGIPAQVAGQLVLDHPQFAKIVDKAISFDKLAATKAKPKESSQAAPPPTRISAKASGTSRDPDKMSTEEWVKWRESQIKRNR